MMTTSKNREIQYRHAGKEIQTASVQPFRPAGVDSFIRPVAEVNSQHGVTYGEPELSVQYGQLLIRHNDCHMRR
jgi:hypothetical protein